MAMTDTSSREFVYLNYTQAELDKAYNQFAWAPDGRDVLARQTAQSEAMRQQLPPRTLQYGPTADECLDVFSPGNGSLPIHVHLHGGAWRALTKDDVSFPARMFVDRNVIYVALNFSVIPAVRLPDMIAQVRNAIRWIYENAATFGGDRDQIHVSGHSAGAHMASMLLVTDWAKRFGLPSQVIKSVLLMSGSYDLEPVMLSARSDYIKLSKQEIHDLSARYLISNVPTRVAIAVGGQESPEFIRQARDFFQVLRDAGNRAEFLEVPKTNHFGMMDVFADATSSLAKTALSFI
jgi:arylformamidase